MTPPETGTLQFPLKVTLTAMSDRTRALIEYYVARSKNRFFAIARSTDTPDVVLIDHDHLGTATYLASGKWRADIPLVILAVGDLQIEGAIMVRKPPDSAGLEIAAAKALQQLTKQRDENRNEDDGQQIFGTIHPPKLTRKTVSGSKTLSSTPTYFRTDDAANPVSPATSVDAKLERYRAKVDQLCGPSRTLLQLRDPHDPDHRFDPLRCLGRRISAVLADPEPGLKAAHFKLPDSDIYLLPTLNKVYTSLSLEYRQNVNRVFRDWRIEDISVITHRQATVNNVIDTLNELPRYNFGAQSFCWLGSLFCAQGRLPTGFDIDTVCKLRHWPNLTRLELIPDSMEIAAVWADREATLSQIVEWVGCEPRHAASFLNAACTIGVMGTESDHGR